VAVAVMVEVEVKRRKSLAFLLEAFLLSSLASRGTSRACLAGVEGLRFSTAPVRGSSKMLLFLRPQAAVGDPV